MSVIGHTQAVTEIAARRSSRSPALRPATTKPEFTSVTVCRRGMEVLQITANFPGKGNVDVLMPTSLADAKKMLDVDDDDFGDLGYRLGSAFLVPYPTGFVASSQPMAKPDHRMAGPYDHPASQ